MKRNTLPGTLAVFLMLGGSVWLSGQQTPLLDQADVQAVIDFCMSPTGEKLMQPPEPGTDRALFCGGIAIGPALALAGMVRNTQVLESHEVRLALAETAIAQLQADVVALQAQSSATLQPQIDAINIKLANAATSLQ